MKNPKTCYFLAIYSNTSGLLWQKRKKKLQAGGPYYAVKKGRKDSKVSLAGKVQPNLPRTNSTVDQLLRLFSSKGLTATDLVALSGAHTIGYSHCNQFASRLYDFHGTKRPDPTMDARLLKALRMSCPQFGGNADVVAPCDVKTPFDFDHVYYGNLESNLGVLATDQALFLDPRTRPIVQELGRDKARFFDAFSTGMEKMGTIRIKKGKRGEIRKDCSKHLSSWFIYFYFLFGIFSSNFFFSKICFVNDLSCLDSFSLFRFIWFLMSSFHTFTIWGSEFIARIVTYCKYYPDFVYLTTIILNLKY